MFLSTRSRLFGECNTGGTFPVFCVFERFTPDHRRNEHDEPHPRPRFDDGHGDSRHAYLLHPGRHRDAGLPDQRRQLAAEHQHHGDDRSRQEHR